MLDVIRSVVKMDLTVFVLLNCSLLVESAQRPYDFWLATVHDLALQPEFVPALREVTLTRRHGTAHHRA
jgi:hypothetical protein